MKWIFNTTTYATLIFIPLLLMSVTSAFAANPPIFESIKSFTVVPSASPTTVLTIPDVSTGLQLDRFLIVGVAIDHQATNKPVVTSITFGPTGSSCSVNQSFTQVASSTSTVTNEIRNEIWQLVGPTGSQTCDVVVTFSATVGDNGGLFDRTPASAVSVYFSNVDQINPIKSSVTNTGNSNTPSVSVVSNAKQHVFDIMSTSSNSGVAPTQGPNQSARLTYATSGFTNFLAGASTQAGGADSSMSWSFVNADYWVISATTIQATPTGGGDGCDSECTVPTLGVDSTGKRLVDGGFKYNNHSADVLYYFTPFPQVLVDVGKENVIELKVYENSGVSSLSHVGVGFAVGDDSSYFESVIRLEVDFNSDGTETVSVFDPKNLLDDVRVETDVVDCMDTSQNKCNLVKIYHTFRAATELNTIGTYIWDDKRNGWQNYFNHGIKITGKLQDLPTTGVAFGEKNMRGLYQLTQIEPLDDIWVDEFGSIYQHMGNNRFDRISQYVEEKLPDPATSHGCDRNCSWFNEYKKGQELIAERKLSQILQYKTIAGELPDSFHIPMNPVSRYDDVDLQNSIKDEIKKANDRYERSYQEYEKPARNFE